jgi:hypothetical protein
VSSAPRRAVCSSGLKSAIYRMKKAIRKISGGNRPGAGRPATGSDPSRTFRLSDEFMAALDAWAARQTDAPNRAEAIRRLVEIALRSELPSKPIARPGRRARAQELARDAIGKMVDPTASPEERDKRRRRLTKGPASFARLALISRRRRGSEHGGKRR